MCGAQYYLSKEVVETSLKYINVIQFANFHMYNRTDVHCYQQEQSIKKMKL